MHTDAADVVQTDCDPSNYAKVHKKPRCPVPGCKEKLTATNTYRCKDCSVIICLKHRFPQDHQCAGKAGKHQAWSSAPAMRVVFISPPACSLLAAHLQCCWVHVAASLTGAAAARHQVAGALRQAWNQVMPGAPPAVRQPPKVPPVSALAADPTNTLRGTAQRRMQVTSL